MDISTLQIFIEVIRQESFAAVARERDVDPSSVSRAISSLEKELGIRLFQRTTRKLSPTEAGITYFRRVEPLVEEIYQAEELVKEALGQPQGTLKVTASVSFGLKCIIPLLPKFEANYPNLIIELLLTDSRLDLLTDKIDLAIRLGKLKESTLIIQRLISTKYFVCASPNYLAQHQPINQPKDIEKHTCLLFPLADFKTHWLFKDKKNKISKISVHGRTIISNAIALQECAIAGMGLALLPNWLIDEDVKSGKIVKVLLDYEVTATDFSTSAWLVYPSRRYVPLKVKVFVDFLKKHLKNN